MNANQQQAVLGLLTQASRALGDAAAAMGGSGGAGGNITVPALYLDFLPEEWRDNPRDYFAYSPPDVLTLAAGTSTAQTFTVQQDSGFLFTSLSGHVSDPANENVIADPHLTISIFDQGSGRNLSNRPVHWQNQVGTAQLPFFLPYPKWFSPTSDIQVTYANIDAAQATRIRLTFHGFKIFGIM